MEISTINNYKKVINICKDIYIKKSKDYGSSWRILRTTSLTDQIFIKAQRIRSVQEKKKMKVEEKIENEFIGIINYCIIAIIQMEYESDEIEIGVEKLENLYDKYTHEIMELLSNKNHDYDEAWRDMRVRSFTDLILQKILRVKRIEDNQGKTLVSEGIDANYFDMINYSIFALIKLSEK